MIFRWEDGRARGRLARERGPPGAAARRSARCTPGWRSSPTPRSPERDGPAPTKPEAGGRPWRTSGSWSPAARAASARGWCGASSARARPSRWSSSPAGVGTAWSLILTAAELAAVEVVETDVDDLEAPSRPQRAGPGSPRSSTSRPSSSRSVPRTPSRGARVNVQGTATMFELARRLGIGPARVREQRRRLRARRTATRTRWWARTPSSTPPRTTACSRSPTSRPRGVYYATGGIASIGLRPHSAYGPGRDQGVTSKPTVAMIAAAGGRPYHVDFGGAYQFQFVEDVAAAFVAAARADRAGRRGVQHRRAADRGGRRSWTSSQTWSRRRAAGSRSATGSSPSPPRSTARRSRRRWAHSR